MSEDSKEKEWIEVEGAEVYDKFKGKETFTTEEVRQLILAQVEAFSKPMAELLAGTAAISATLLHSCRSQDPDHLISTIIQTKANLDIMPQLVDVACSYAFDLPMANLCGLSLEEAAEQIDALVKEAMSKAGDSLTAHLEECGCLEPEQEASDFFGTPDRSEDN